MFWVIRGWKWCQNPVAVCAINIVKTMVLVIFHFFHLFHNLVSPGRVLGVILVTFGDLGHTFNDIWGYWEQASNFMVFQEFPGTPQVESTTPVGGNVFIQLGSKLANLEHSGCQNTSYKTLSCKFTGSERITRLSAYKLLHWTVLQGCKLTNWEVEVITGLLDWFQYPPQPGGP